MGHSMEHEQITEIETVDHGTDSFVIADGVTIAKRGRPGTPQAGTWISLEPGWRVLDESDLSAIIVEHNGVRVH